MSIACKEILPPKLALLETNLVGDYCAGEVFIVYVTFAVQFYAVR